MTKNIIYTFLISQQISFLTVFIFRIYYIFLSNHIKIICWKSVQLSLQNLKKYLIFRFWGNYKNFFIKDHRLFVIILRKFIEVFLFIFIPFYSFLHVCLFINSFGKKVFVSLNIRFFVFVQNLIILCNFAEIYKGIKKYAFSEILRKYKIFILDNLKLIFSRLLQYPKAR